MRIKLKLLDYYTILSLETLREVTAVGKVQSVGDLFEREVRV